MTSLVSALTMANAFAFSNNSRGFFKAKIKTYTNDVNNLNGQNYQFEIENNLKLNETYSFKNQVRALSSTLSDDVTTKYKASYKDRFRLSLGENYFKLNSDKFVLQAGYQEVIWGEAFGLNYADFITPKDLRETVYSDVSETRLPLLLINSKYFFNLGQYSGSLQVLFSPEPRFNKQLPLDLFIGDLFPINNIELIEEDKKQIFNESEYGGKFSLSIEGHDLSVFAYNYFDRSAYYTINTLNASTLSLKENHAPIQSIGLSYAKTISEFVFRSDIVKTQDKVINYYSNQQLFNDTSDVYDILLSLDSPTYNNYSGLIVFGVSSLTNTNQRFIRDQKEQYIITKISKTFENEKSLDLSFTREFSSGGNAVQTQFNIPLSNTLEFKLGGEFYFGADNSNLNHLKNMNNIYFSLKNFLQI
jgi:hypothetical protein